MINLGKFDETRLEDYDDEKEKVSPCSHVDCGNMNCVFCPLKGLKPDVYTEYQVAEILAEHVLEG